MKVKYTANANSHKNIEKNINDGNPETYYYGSNNACNVELDFGSSNVVLLRKIKYLPSVWRQVYDFDGSSFEGFNLQTNAWENIYTLKVFDMNQGWNTYNLPDNFSTLYSKIRYVGLSTKN